MSSLVLALTAISLAAQQTIGLNRLRSCENGWLKIRHLLGEAPGKEDHHPTASHGSDDAKDVSNRTRIKRSQLWAWQTPIMMSNFAILLFIVGLMIAIFARAAATMGDWSKPDGKVPHSLLLLGTIKLTEVSRLRYSSAVRPFLPASTT